MPSGPMVASLPIVLLCRYAISAPEKTLMPRRRSCRLGGRLQVLRLRDLEFECSGGHRWIWPTRFAYARTALKIIGQHGRRRWQIWEAGPMLFAGRLRG